MDVVVPFKGGAEALGELRARLAQLELRADDTIVIVDNTPGRGRDGERNDGGARVLVACGQTTPGYARNRGAELGSADWVVFVDADTEPRPDLLDRYFDQFPLPHVGLLAGGVVDEEVPVTGPGPARYAYLRNTLSQDRTFSKGQWAFAQTANVACRRMAFEAVGGFREGIRSAEDADMSYRLKAAGWQIERREAAVRRSPQPAQCACVRRTGHAAWCRRRLAGHPLPGIVPVQAPSGSGLVGDPRDREGPVRRRARARSRPAGLGGIRLAVGAVV